MAAFLLGLLVAWLSISIHTSLAPAGGAKKLLWSVLMLALLMELSR